MAARQTYIAAGLIGLALCLVALALAGLSRLLDSGPTPADGPPAPPIAADAGPG